MRTLRAAIAAGIVAAAFEAVPAAMIPPLPPERVRRLCKTLVAQGELFLVAHDHYFPRESVAELAAILRDLNDGDGDARATNFRDRIGTGRKVAIQILEFFDRIGVSRRIGDSHKLFQDSMMQVR